MDFQPLSPGVLQDDRPRVKHAVLGYLPLRKNAQVPGCMPERGAMANKNMQLITIAKLVDGLLDIARYSLSCLS